MFTETLWTAWSEQEAANYKITKTKTGTVCKKYLKKGYIHFDHKFWFPERKNELKELLRKRLRVYNKLHKRDEWHAFSPFIKILIKTPRYKYQKTEGKYDLETKIRPICFASHIDNLIFAFYAYALTRKYEEYIAYHKFDECVLAYRSNLSGKCNIQFSKEVFDEVRKRSNCTAIALDIKGYFDHIDHVKLKEKWVKVIGELLPDDQFKLYKCLTQYSYVNKNSILRKYEINLKKLERPPSTLLKLVPGEENYQKFQRLRNDKLIVKNDKPKKAGKLIGIPQGSAMSALLSNIYLIDYDEAMMLKAKEEGFLYRRYCDDILIICDSVKAEDLQRFAIEKIDKDYGLEIQPKKVELTEFKPDSRGKIRAFNKKKMIDKGILTTDVFNEKSFF